MSILVLFHVKSSSKTFCFDEMNCSLRDIFSTYLGSFAEDVFVICNGKLVSIDSVLEHGHAYHVIPKVLGGKGGFGSMLRAIGAQIEKTTSREACRDLSGRRMRDVNNEKKLKEWIAKQADRERERGEKRKERLAKRNAPVQHNFNDSTYDEQRSKVLHNLDDSFQKGLARVQSKPTPTSTVTSEMVISEKSDRKRKAGPGDLVKTKKPKEWLGVDLDELDSDDSSEERSEPSTESCSVGNGSTRPAMKCTDKSECSEEKGKHSEAEIGSFEETKTLSLNREISGITETSSTRKNLCAAETSSGLESTSSAEICSITENTDTTENNPCLAETDEMDSVNSEKDTVTEIQIEESGNSSENSSSTNTLTASLTYHVYAGQEMVGSNIEKKEMKMEPLDLSMIETVSELDALGLDNLKAELVRRGLKCGGTLQERAKRLFSVKDLKPDEIDPSLLSKPQKGKAKIKKQS